MRWHDCFPPRAGATTWTESTRRTASSRATPRRRTRRWMRPAERTWTSRWSPQMRAVPQEGGTARTTGSSTRTSRSCARRLKARTSASSTRGWWASRAARAVSAGETAECCGEQTTPQRGASRTGRAPCRRSWQGSARRYRSCAERQTWTLQRCTFQARRMAWRTGFHVFVGTTTEETGESTTWSSRRRAGARGESSHWMDRQTPWAVTHTVRVSSRR